MQQVPKNLAKCQRTSCGLLIATRIRRSCSARLRPTIAVNLITEAVPAGVTVTAESGKLTAQHDALLLGHAGLVRRIAYHLFRRRTYVDVDDLIRAGMVGLSEAIRGHGHDTAEFFEAYASVRIRGAMLDFVRRSDWSLWSGRRGLPSIEQRGVKAGWREFRWQMQEVKY